MSTKSQTTIMQKILQKIIAVETKMEELKPNHLYYLTTEWKLLVAQVEILNELYHEL